MDVGEAMCDEDMEYMSDDMDEPENPPIASLPFSVLTSIVGLLDSTRCRNAASLVCRLWKEAERSTRTSLTLRGNVCHLLNIPLSFSHVQHLDLTEITPWGSSLLQGDNGVEDVLQRAFPLVKKLRLYAREIWDMDMMAQIWPSLEEVHIVRWHERTELQTSSVVSTELAFLMRQCKTLKVVDLSQFYCWVEDIPPALEASATTAQSLQVLKLQKFAPDSFTKTSFIRVLAVCHLLEHLEVVCEFDPRYEDSVDDATLTAIADNCPKLRKLKMTSDDEEVWRSRVAGDELVTCDMRVTRVGLSALLTGLSLLEELSIVSAHPVLESGRALSCVPVLCKNLRRLEIGCFLDACVGPLDLGLASATNLTSIAIRRCPDFSDDGLMAIQSSCRLLTSLTISACRSITGVGLNSLATALSSTLEDVSISNCQAIGAADLLQALAPLRGKLRRLHLGILARDREKRTHHLAAAVMARPTEDPLRTNHGPPVLRRRIDDHVASSSSPPPAPPQLNSRSSSSTTSSSQPAEDLSRFVCGVSSGASSVNDMVGLEWPKLEELSLWVELGVQLDLLFPLAFLGCEKLSRVRIRVEGDCSVVQGPRAGTSFGLHLMHRIPSLRSLFLDLHRLRGYTNTIPIFGPATVHVWERHYLLGIQQLPLNTVEYWPPACRESGQRAIALPGAGILSMCLHMRKLTIHGTVTEHVLNMLRRSRSLRDAHFKTDYYPASEDTNVEGWLRFESAMLNNKIPD